MNIFKVLAQGDGGIHEPNVSAFLGYLLNPSQDHGLDSSFLEAFLRQHYYFCKSFQDDDGKEQLETDLDGDEPLSAHYETRLFFEQAFRSSGNAKLERGTKSIVDIILVVYKLSAANKESKFEVYLKEKRELSKIFLIEVKVDDKACGSSADQNKEGQLEEQLKGSRSLVFDILLQQDSKRTLQETDKLLSAIFVTPGRDCPKAKQAFAKSFNHAELKNISKSHLYWNRPDNAGTIQDIYTLENDTLQVNLPTDDINKDEEWLTVEDLVDTICYPHKSDKQLPIPSYTVDTLKSFSDFIDSNFSYKPKKVKQYTQKAFKNLEELKSQYSELFSDELFTLIAESKELLENRLATRIDPIEKVGIHHIISFSLDGNVFASITKYTTKTIKLRFLKTNYKRHNLAVPSDSEFAAMFPDRKWKIKTIGDAFVLFTQPTTTASEVSDVITAFHENYIHILSSNGLEMIGNSELDRAPVR